MDLLESGATKSAHAEAHGRVNLIGEHTDYNGGYVLPTLIDQVTKIKLSPRADKKVRIKASFGHFEYELGHEKATHHWADYIQGVTDLLLKAGHAISGFELDITSDLPVGSGLSSSAALDTALLRALRTAFDLKLDDMQLALLGQKVENNFVGANVGIMDPMVCSLARPREALFIDTATLSFERIPLPYDKMTLWVIHSGVSHRLSSAGGYNTRHAECMSAAKLLGVSTLREIEVNDLPRVCEICPPVLAKRVRHVVTENLRVVKAVDALKKNALDELGRLFADSHASMRDDFEVSTPEIDSLVEIAAAHKDQIWGARLTGGGFGGSVVLLGRPHLSRDVLDDIVSQYKLRWAFTPQLFPVTGQ